METIVLLHFRLQRYCGVKYALKQKKRISIKKAGFQRFTEAIMVRVAIPTLLQPAIMVRVAIPTLLQPILDSEDILAAIDSDGSNGSEDSSFEESSEASEADSSASPSDNGTADDEEVVGPTDAWVLKHKFDSADELAKHIPDKVSYYKRQVNLSPKYGTVRNYECRVHNCGYKLRVKENHFIIESFGKHVGPHDNTNNRRGLTQEQRDFVDNDCLSLGVSGSKGILSRMNASNIPLPSKNSLRSYVNYTKGKKYGNTSSVTLNDLESFAQEHLVDIEEDKDKVFALHTEFNASNKSFRIVLSTHRLLDSIPTVVRWHCDATYKLVYHGYPLLVGGYSDANNRFHVCTVALCSTEQQADFVPTFSCIKGISKIILIIDRITVQNRTFHVLLTEK